MKIEGQRVILSDEPKDDTSEYYFRWFNLEEWQYYDTPDKPFKPISREVFEERAKKNRERYEEHAKDESKPSPGYRIETVDGQFIGWVSTYNWDEEGESDFIGIGIPEEENRDIGYGTEAVRLYLNLLFESFGLETIRTATWTGNKRMVRCAQKAGFKDYEIMSHRTPVSVRGEPLERIEFSLSSDEWYKANRDGG
jgi:RimJ/RimL family protein N-acetyltransferase